MVIRLNQAKTEAERVQIFTEELFRLPKGHARRDDFLWMIGRAVQPRLTEDAAEGIAYAAAILAEDYAYDILNIRLAARAIKLVSDTAQETSSTLYAES